MVGMLTDSGPQSVRQYTVGATMTLAQSERLTHSFVAGIDGYRLDNATNGIATLPSSPDAALRAASGAADRTTLRASSSLQLGGEGRSAGNVTLTAEHSLLREQTVAGVTPSGRDSLGRSTWWSTSGLVAEASGSIDDAWYATGGVRFEQDGKTRPAFLPMVGAAYVRDLGLVTAKVRTAYGRGLRPARTAVREAAWLGVRNLNTSELAPEEQSGIEVGADLVVGRALSMHVTRFDQRAYGLIQPVAMMSESVLMTGIPSRMAYRLQNVGEIANRGWELQSTLGMGRLLLTSALALVDSRVTRVDSGYTGDLRADDRMLGVPARTASVTASWNALRWSTSWSISRASDWINYDRLAIANALSGTSTTMRGIAGQDLRLFWRDYGGVTHLRASFSRDLARRWTVSFTGENLLNQQEGEPDDLSVMPGRTLSLGLRARF
jgi:iron complex outermembrane receptor protein